MNIYHVIDISCGTSIALLMLVGIAYATRMLYIHTLSQNRTYVLPEEIQSSLTFWSSAILYAILGFVFAMGIMLMLKTIWNLFGFESWIRYFVEPIVDTAFFLTSRSIGKWWGTNNFYGWLRQQA